MDNMNQSNAQTVGNIVAKQKRPGKSAQMQPQTSPGDNARYIRHSLRLADLPPVSMQDGAAVKERVYTYFKICEQEDMKPSVAGLALALDCDRTYLWKIRSGDREGKPEVVHAIKKAMKLLDLQMVDYMQNGKINPVSGIFLMKNNFGYADKQEVEIKPSSPFGETKDIKALEDQYRDSVPIDIDCTDIDE